MKKIEKGYTDFVGGMMYGMRQQGTGSKQVDWKKLKSFIESNKSEIKSVYAGLAEDWGYTSGEIWNSEEGYISQSDTYVHASSTWATPSFEVEYSNGQEETVECWVDGDDAGSYFS